jgi:RNA polymerase sigma-70 factor, ECF subfamily
MGQKANAVVTKPAQLLPDLDSISADPARDLEALYRAHQRTVMRWAARLGGPGIDVEDVVQDVFLIARRRLGSFNEPGKVVTWLFRTTDRVVLAARRKQRLRRWLSRSTEPSASGASAPRPTPGEALEREQEIRQVYRVLDRLSDRERRVLILFELEGLSTHEIGELIGARVGTVRVRLFRARARFMEEHLRLFPADAPPWDEDVET